jgi:hypothetical protein
VNDVEFLLVFLFWKAVRVQSAVEKFDGCVFELCGMVGGIGYVGVCKGGFPVDGCY